MRPKNGKGSLIPSIHRFLCIHTYMSPLCILFALMLIPLVVLQTILFVKQRDVKFFMQYAQFYFSTIYGVNVNIIYPFAMNSFTSTLRSNGGLFVVDLSRAQPKTLKKIRKLVKQEELKFLLWFFIAFLALSLVNYSWAQNREYYMTVSFLLKQHVPLDSAGAQIIQWAMHLILMQTAIPSIAVPIYFVYFVFHLKIHLMMLIEYVDTFEHNGESSEPRNIMKKIRHIVERHAELKRHSMRTTLNYQLLIYVLYIANGLLVGLTSVYSIIAPDVNTRDGLAMLFAYFVYAYGACDCVQNYMDLSTTLFRSISNLKWYQWNTQCNKMYIMLLTSAARGLHISILLVVNINNDLFKKICRITYGFANFFHSFTVRK